MDPLETEFEEEPRYSGSFKVQGLVVGVDHFPLKNNDNDTITTAPQLILSQDLLNAVMERELGDVLCISNGNDGPR